MTLVIEEAMKNQILQLFHNLMERKRIPDEKIDENHLDWEQFYDAAQAGSGDSSNKEVSGPVKMVDRKTFEILVNESLGMRKGKGCLLIGDVDRCRDINNIYGHETGDAVLHHIETVLCDVFRGYACIGSRGSDIFALWMPTRTKSSAAAVRIMTGLVNDRLLHPMTELPPTSLSVGVSFCEPGDNCRSLVKKANKALYIVKESGRCGCEWASE